MISIKDSLLLAKVKFRQKKIRFLLTAGAISTGVIIIGVIAIGSTGLVSFMRDITKNSLDGRYFVQENIYSFTDEGDSTQFPTKEQYLDRNKEYDIKDLFISWQVRAQVLEDNYEETELSDEVESINEAAEGAPVPGWGYPVTSEGTFTERNFGISEVNDTYLTGLYFTEELLVSDYLFEGYTLEDEYGGSIPVLVPVSMLVDYYKPGQTSEERHRELAKVVDTVKGEDFDLSLITYEFNQNGFPNSESTTADELGIKVVIVGIVPQSFWSTYSSGEQNNITLPTWAAEKEEVKDLDTVFVEQIYVSEFDTKDERSEFTEGSSDGSGYRSERRSALESLDEPMKWIRRIGYGIGGFFLLMSSLFVMFTLGKLVSDSRKEIGMFRAVGASKGDIKYIFFTYAFWLITSGYLIGILIAVLFCTLVSLLWGDNFFYSVSDFSTNLSYEKPLLLFVGFAPLQLIVLYLITLISGFLAALIPAVKASKVDPIIVLKEA